MRISRFILTCLIILACFLGGGVERGSTQDLQPIPPLTGRVVDTVGAISPQDKASLEEELSSIEKEKGAQIAILLVGTTQPEAIEQFSLRVAESWKIGRKKVDDGALLVLAMQDHAMRLEIGYGLEGVLPDITAKRLLSGTLMPFLRQNQTAAGLHAILTEIHKLIAGEELPPPSNSSSRADDNSSLWFLVVIGLFAIAFFSSVLGKFAGSTLATIGVFIIGWLIASFITGITAAVIVAVLGAMGGNSGFYMGGRGGGSFGGGFSGGGGSFGGGGASGRW